MLTPIPEEFLGIISGNNGMLQYLKSLLENRAFTPRSYIYDGYKGDRYLTPQGVLEKWTKILRARLETGDDFERNVLDFDISQTEKYGPQGGHEPISDLMESIVLPSFGMAGQEVPAFEEEDWELAIRDALDILRLNGVHDLYPKSYKRVVNNMSMRGTLESNSGWPDFTRRNKPEVISAAIEAASNGEWKKFPAIALFRRYNGKTRLVWMFPFAVNIVEGSWFQPLYDAISASPRLIDYFFSPWKGFDAVRKYVTDVYQNRNGAEIAASDFTSTDAHFQKAATQEVLKVLKPLFKPQFRDALEESLMYMHEIPLIVGPTEMLTGDHGVSSGSNWTNFIETIFDLILSRYVSRKLEGVFGMYAIGDDMAWTSMHFDEDFQSKLEELGKAAGQIIKAEKTMAEPNKVKTLQRLFQRGYSRPDGLLRGVYPTIRALKSLIYPERFHGNWSDDLECVRAFMILENCVDHPLFQEFVEFVCKGDWRLIPFAKKTTQQLEQIHRKAKLVPGLVSTYNQEKRDTSLAAFESIRIAREL